MDISFINSIVSISPDRMRLSSLLFGAMPLSGCQWQGAAGDGVIDLTGTVDAREVALAFQVGGPPADTVR